MAGIKSYQPLYSQFILEIEKGFSLLDKSSQAEIKAFVKTQQHKNGAFTDRGGNPDLYYSLFAVWLSKALKLDEQQKKLRQFIAFIQPDKYKVVDKFSLLLIGLTLDKDDVKKPTLFELFLWIFKSGKNMNVAYRFFLFMLSFDALFGKNRVIYSVLRIFLNFYRPANDLPCSFFSAFILAKFITGGKVKKELAVVQEYYEKGKGFKVFRENHFADLLSTGVALFALKKVGADLRMVAPDCLSLVQENYANGAFLSGDGDPSRDLEYTFYGMLSLGVLSKKNE